MNIHTKYGSNWPSDFREDKRQTTTLFDTFSLLVSFV